MSASVSIDPRDVITGFFADVEAGRAEQAFARLAPDIVYHVIAPPPYGGPMSVAELARSAQAVFSRLAQPLKLKVTTIVAEGDRVVAEVKGDAPTKRGGNYDNDYLFIYRVIDGVIVEAKEYLDSAKYMALIDDKL